MANLKAQLEIGANVTGVEVGVSKAKRSLADLGATAAAAGKEGAAGIEQIGQGADRSSKQIATATRNAESSLQRQIALLSAGERGSRQYNEALFGGRGADLGKLRPLLDQLDELQAKQKIASAAISAGAKPLQQYTMSAAATAAALRQVPSQFTDIITSLQGGQKPLTVLLQQGGQLKDVFGGIGPAARALGGYILGLVNPFTIAAAAAAALAYVYSKGSDEASTYSKALILSGNAAGATAGQLQSIAKAISDVAGTQGNAADAVAQFAESGNVAASNLQRVAQAAVVFERDTGQAISETVKQFAELGRSPVDASVKLNESLHYLTISTYQQIKALEDQGRQTDAAALAQRAYADAIESRGNQIEARLGTIQRLWIGIKDATKGALDAALSVGRGSSVNESIDLARSKLAELDVRQSRGARNPTSDAAFAKARQAINDQIAGLTKQVSLEESVAKSAKASADQVQARVKFDRDGEQFLSNQAKMEREITKAKTEGVAAGVSAVEIAKREADIRAKYADKGAARTALAIDKSTLASDLSALQKASDQLVGVFSNQERVLEALRSAGGLSDEQYYRKKREYIIAETEVADYGLQRQIDRAAKEKLAGKDAIDNARKVAEITSAQAKLRTDAAGKLEVLSVQEKASADKLALAFLTARQAAQDYFDVVQKQQVRELNSFGLGNQQRDFNAGISQIEDRYGGQRRDLENQGSRLQLDGKYTDDAKSQYEKQLRDINEFQDRSIASYGAYYAKRVQMESDASLGAKEALQNYIDEAGKVGKLTEQAYTNAFSNIENALTQFVSTGKLSFRDLANSIISDLVRIQVKAALAKVASSASASGGGGWLGLIGGLVGAFSGTAGTASIASSIGGDSLDNFLALNNNFRGPRAIGGPVSAGGMYEVNEHGPELLQSGGHSYLMMGAQSGNVVPNGGTGESKLTVVNNTSGKVDRATEKRISPTERMLILEEAEARVAASWGDPNSRNSRSFSRHVKAPRNR